MGLGPEEWARIQESPFKLVKPLRPTEYPRPYPTPASACQGEPGSSQGQSESTKVFQGRPGSAMISQVSHDQTLPGSGLIEAIISQD